jgi:hypothetical protein
MAQPQKTRVKTYPNVINLAVAHVCHCFVEKEDAGIGVARSLPRGRPDGMDGLRKNVSSVSAGDNQRYCVRNEVEII